MQAIKCRLPINSNRFVLAAGIIRRNEQKRLSTLTMQTLNPLVKEVEYAVRGPIVIRAGEIERQLKNKVFAESKQTFFFSTHL
ncbi:unnamed protein product [Adineta steineri]|uniref:Uncharacterized protein n=1 Tax=Adineta steineri TaxID=433720 RepID=A0A814NGN3_9BILA|nr:unnamed protein product [Adineta steineri]